MNRRNFIRQSIRAGVVVVPAFHIFVPRLLRAQSDLSTAEGLAAFGTNAPAGGGGGGALQFITSVSGGTTGSGIVWKAGFLFSPSVAMTVTALGLIRISTSSHAHTVRLWDAGTTGTTCSVELANASVNLSSVSAGQFAWGSITGFSLTIGRYYEFYADQTTDGDLYYNDNVTLATTGDGAISKSSYFDTSCHVGTNGVHAYGVPNFQYTTP